MSNIEDHHALSATEKPAATPSKTQHQPLRTTLPSNLIYIGIIVGLILIAAGISLLVTGRPSLLSSLMTCVGFGIVLVAFGSTAGGSWGGWSATIGRDGCPVVLDIAVFLCGCNWIGRDGCPVVLDIAVFFSRVDARSCKKGQIRGDFSKVADFRIIDEAPLDEYRATESLRFIFLDKSLHSERLSVQIDTTEKGPGRETFEMIGSAKVISERYLSNTGPKSNLAQWVFDYNQRTIKDGPTILFAEADKLDENMFPKQGQTSIKSWPSLTEHANAQTSPSVLTNALSPSDLQSQSNSNVSSDIGAASIQNLKSDDPHCRNARDALVGNGASSTRAIMTAWRAHPLGLQIEERINIFSVYSSERRSTQGG